MITFTEPVIIAPVAPSRTRYLIVVRRSDESTYHYLKARLGGVRDVEIALDRRTALSPPTSDDRRRAPAGFNAFGVLLVRR